MANISLSESMCNLSSSFIGLKDLSLTALSTLSASIGNVSYSGEFTTAISDFNHFNPANTNRPNSSSTTYQLNDFDGYDHYKNWIFETGSTFSSTTTDIASNTNVPDVKLAETIFGDSNRGHSPSRNAAIVLSGSGEPLILTAYRNEDNTAHKYCGHVIKSFDSGAYAASGGGTGSIQRLTVAEATTGITNGSNVRLFAIDSGSAVLVSRDQTQSGRTYGQFINAEGDLTALTAIHTNKTNNFSSHEYTNFSQSAIAYLTMRGNMEAKPSVIRKQGVTLNPDIAAEPTKPSGYSNFTCGEHGVLLAYRSGSDNGVGKKFFYVCWHSYGGAYKSNTLFYATPSQTEYNSDTGTWPTIGSTNWTLINDDWKSQTAVKGSSNVGDFVGKHPDTGDDWIVWFSLMGEGTTNSALAHSPVGQTYCHSARITQADSVTITDLSSQMGLNELTGSRRYRNAASSNAGGRCWQHFNIVSRKDVTTEFVLHFNTFSTGSAQFAHYNFDLRTGELSLIAQLTASVRNINGGSSLQDDIRVKNNGMSGRFHTIPLGNNWNARDLYRAAPPTEQSRHAIFEYSDMQANVSKSGWIRGINLQTS